MVKQFFDDYVTWKALGTVIALLLFAFGFAMDTALDARTCAQETRDSVSKDYVPKDQYRIDIENLNKKVDFLIELQVKKNP